MPEQSADSRTVRLYPASGAQGHTCAGGCGACNALSRMDLQVPPRHYLLGALWAFAVPMLGLIIGCALAAGWTGRPVWQAVAIAGGLAAGVALGVLGRWLTVPPLPAATVYRCEMQQDPLPAFPVQRTEDPGNRDRKV